MVSNAINIYLLVSELQYHKSYMFTNNFFMHLKLKPQCMIFVIICKKFS